MSKKAIIVLLFTVLLLTLGLSSCVNSNKSSNHSNEDNQDANNYINEITQTDVVGVWKSANSKNHYLYIYKDGTADYYTTLQADQDFMYHKRKFSWHIEGEYLATSETYKYRIDGDCLYDSQERLEFTKFSSDTTVDIEYEYNSDY